MKNRYPSSTRGQTIVEFALVLSILLILILVLVDAGRAVYAYSSIQNAAREGARYGTVHPDNPTNIINETRRLITGLNQANLTVITDNPTTDQVRVRITYIFTPATPILLLLQGTNTLTLNSRAVMYIER